MATNKACSNGALGSEFQDELERVNGAIYGSTVGSFGSVILLWGCVGAVPIMINANSCQRHSPQFMRGGYLCSSMSIKTRIILA